jgi:hypothetical protein
MTRPDLIAAVRTVKPDLSERECLAIVRGVLGVVREPSGALGWIGYDVAGQDVDDAFTAMIDALLGEVGE